MDATRTLLVIAAVIVFLCLLAWAAAGEIRSAQLLRHCQDAGGTYRDGFCEGRFLK